MRILLVDDEQDNLIALEEKVREEIPSAELHPFQFADEALAFAETNPIDIAFLDIELGVMNGVELAKNLKMLRANTNIVFCSGFMEYMPDAFELGVSDYLMKPITGEKVRHALSLLRKPLVLRIPQDRLYVRCFGEFEVFWKGEPLQSLTKRAKELFAYLVEKRGALCATKEITQDLFKEMADANFRIARKNLETAFEEIGLGDVMIKNWGKIGVMPSKFVCDLYEYENGNPEAVNLYHGEYMKQYAWAKDLLKRD